MKKIVYSFMICFVTIYNLSAQDIYNIADGGSFVFQCSSGTATVTDSDVNGGNYGPNEDYEITFCLGDGVAGNIQVVISPELYGDTWDVDDASFLFVHDGPTSASPLIGGGLFNSVNDPAGILVAASQGCITLVFTSGAASSGAGFTANIQCETAFQPFTLDFESEPDFSETSLSANTITLCFADSFSVSAITSYPLSEASGNGYEQSDETSYFNWQMGDGTSFQGFGLTEIAYAYESGSGYQINVSVIDAAGTIQYFQFFVLQSPRPNFSNVALDDTLCIGSQTVITGGINPSTLDTVAVDEGTGAILGGGTVGGQEDVVDADPDDCDAVYTIPLIIDEFEDGQTLQDVNDIFNICLNMWHTYLGDLEIGLVCPNGNDTLVLFDMMDDQGQCDGMFDVGPNGSGRDLGDPGATPFEVGFDYCWNNDPDFGTFAEEDLTQTGSMAAGSYTTMTNLNTLIGCPLNGEWQLLIKDSYQADVGVVNSWSLFLNPDINPSTEYYSPGIVSAGWDENQDLIINDDSVSVTVAPSQEGNNAFTFFAYDEFGCRHDTTIFIYVRPDVIAGPDLIACDLMHTLTAQNAPGGGEWVMLDSPSNTSTVSYEYLLEGTANITVNEYGIYSFQITENNCGYQDESEIDFRPDPVVLPLVADTVLCVGGSFILDAGPQEDNSDNFNINWTRNNTTFNAEDYAVLVDQTGQYIITITGVCGTASDTSNIVAIELLFEGDTLCGLETLQPVNVELSPEGNGVWTSTAENITFSDPTGLSTFITSSQYGGFPVMFTDSRCPDDGLELNFQFVEQPTVEVLPQNPEFCLELDSLIITTNVSGNNTGDFFWNISGEGSQPVFSQNDSLFFGPESFLPLEVYTVQVQIFDNFGVCNVASGSMTFDGLWCTYTIPNVITPNGDGQNDRFMIEFMEYFPGTQLTIFNRWGNVVFDQSNYDQYQVMNNGWDPEDLSAGVYFYELKVPQVREVVSGNLTIIR